MSIFLLWLLFLTLKLDFHAHVSDVQKSRLYQLERLKSIRLFIPESLFATLVHAFITRRLDFCNSFILYVIQSQIYFRYKLLLISHRSQG